MADNLPQFWERQPGETARAYAAFCAYRDFGLGRSIIKAYSESKGLRKGAQKYAPKWWKEWSRRHKWVDRADAYGVYLSEQVRAGYENVWIARRRQLDEQDWQTGLRLREHAESLLAESPKVDANIGQVSTAIRTASELQRLAASETNTRINVDGVSVRITLIVTDAKLDG